MVAVEQRQRVQSAKILCLLPPIPAFRRTKPLCWASLVPFVPFVAFGLQRKDLVVRRLSWHKTPVVEEAEEALVAVVADTVAVAEQLGFERTAIGVLRLVAA